MFPVHGFLEGTTAHQQPWSLGTPFVLSWKSHVYSSLVTRGWEEAICFVAFLPTYIESQDGCISSPPLEESSGLYHPGSKGCLSPCLHLTLMNRSLQPPDCCEPLGLKRTPQKQRTWIGHLGLAVKSGLEPRITLGSPYLYTGFFSLPYHIAPMSMAAM